MLADLWRLARPTHWIKNVFVLLPVPFALADATQPGVELIPGVFLLGLLGFCLTNSGVYTLNDLLDAEADRLHPRKRNRPIAAGRISTTAAAVQGAVLFLIGLGLCLATGKMAAGWLALLYVAVNLTYSLRAKRVALLDVFLLSSGYVIRVLLGCVLITASPSAWLLLCTSSLALFVGFAKRRADLTAGLDHNHRQSLRGYSKAFLDQATAICAGVALAAYALYSLESSVFLAGRQLASIPFAAYAILNYLRLAEIENAGGSPVEIVYRSPSIQLCALGWAAAVAWSLGKW
jgi:decaprenyl-phosphate phosphoribosyltransferase